MDGGRRALAFEICLKARDLQRQGELELAATLFQKSISIHPTAEAYTSLGWIYARQERFSDAIAECQRAIEVDAEYGNPYNDIGAYLLEQGKAEEAVPWLEKATRSRRYQTYHLPWYNLGRAWVALELYARAVECFQNAIDIEPGYRAAEDALERVKRVIQ